MTLAVDRPRPFTKLGNHSCGSLGCQLQREGSTHYEALPKAAAAAALMFTTFLDYARLRSSRDTPEPELLRWDRTLLHGNAQAAHCCIHIYRIVIVCGIVINMYFYCRLTRCELKNIAALGSDVPTVIVSRVLYKRPNLWGSIYRSWYAVGCLVPG